MTIYTFKYKIKMQIQYRLEYFLKINVQLDSGDLNRKARSPGVVCSLQGWARCAAPPASGRDGRIDYFNFKY